MCFARSQAFNKEELSALGWGEIEEAGPSEEELIDQYYEYKYSVYVHQTFWISGGGWWRVSNGPL